MTNRIATQKEAAKLLGITARQLRDWAKEPWWPVDARNAGGYDVAAIREARDRQGRKGSEESNRAQQVRLARDEERARREKIRRERDELALAAERGEVVPRAAVELHFSEFLTRFGDWADQFPDLLKRQVPKKQAAKVRAWAKEQLDEFRTSLAAELEAAAREWDKEAEAA